jgi:hypothetical protein
VSGKLNLIDLAGHIYTIPTQNWPRFG